jgi:rhomboid protease GluP
MTDNDNSDIIILETNSQDHLSSCSLVLSAVNITHTISTLDGKSIILVSHEKETEARYQLESYLSENKNWPPEKEFTEQNNSAIQPPTLLLIGALILFYGVTGPWSEHSEWFQNGAGDATAILRDGQYYRLITALTLHADITHLLGNCFLGGFLIHFFCRTAGPGLGLFAILVSAILGNYINVRLHVDNHHFIGFSTAVFATIGMLAMINYHANKKFSGYHVLVPFMAGAALLAMTGSSGERTDLGAHLFGLFSGFLIGRLLVVRTMRNLRSSFSLQVFLFLFTALIIWASWDAAMVKVY